MLTARILSASCLVTLVATAQSFSTTIPGAFVDISATGTPLTGVMDDSEHDVVTTIGNALFPAGNVRIGNNGVAVAGITSGDVAFTNAAIPASGLAPGLPAGGSGYLCPFWDDLFPTAGSAMSIFYREDPGVLRIMWKNETHFDFQSAAQTITFEIVVNGPDQPPCAPLIQFIYQDSTFGGTAAAYDAGASATIGYLAGTNAAASNAQFSFDTPSVPSGTVVSILAATTLSASSPFGPGSLQLSLAAGPCGGTYVLAVTLVQGAFPNGWLFGVDIPVNELAGEIAAGAPYVGPLSATGTLVLGPFGGLPPVTIYAVALGFTNGTLNGHSPPFTYAIP
jgi:hypothetical protein